ncbi:Heptahelical transmembrane protein 2 [Balamuthia mandrillaris]
MDEMKPSSTSSALHKRTTTSSSSKSPRSYIPPSTSAASTSPPFDNVRRITQRVAKADRTLRSGTLEEIVKEDNPFLTHGHREQPSLSIRKCLRSAFELHNETLNIWTHGLGFLLFFFYLLQMWCFVPTTAGGEVGGAAGAALRGNERLIAASPTVPLSTALVKSTVASTEDDEFSWLDRLQLRGAPPIPPEHKAVFLLYLFSIATCFGISTFYHIFRNYSVNAYANWLISDINGVGFYIYGCNVLVSYFTFLSPPSSPLSPSLLTSTSFWSWAYLLLNTLLYFPMALAMPLIVEYKFFNLRSFLFALLTLLGAVAYWHAILLLWPPFWEELTWGIAVVPICAVLSMIIRKIKYPERLCPKIFSIWGSSHTWFHVLVTYSMYVLYDCYFVTYGPGGYFYRYDQQPIP